MRKAIVLVWGSLLLGCSENRPKPRQVNNLDSVEIEQTRVKNQKAVGLCWSYATIGMIESLTKHNKNLDINLSEEALAFFRIAESLELYANSYLQGNIGYETLKRILDSDPLDGWFIRLPHWDKRLDAFELVEKYGVVEEKEWNRKFNWRLGRMDHVYYSEFNELRKNIINAFLVKIDQLHSANEKITPQDIYDVMTVDGAFHSVPATSKKLTEEIIGFKADDFALMSAQNSRSSTRMIAALKRSLASGISVPMAHGVKYDLLQKGSFNYQLESHDHYDNISTNRARNFFAKNGMHAVLATDFVNHGAHEGAMPTKMLIEEVKKPTSELSYLVFKNSWGINSRSRSDERTRNSREGYNKMNLGYIRGIADAGSFSIVVPRSIAEDPYGEIIIDKSVTTDDPTSDTPAPSEPEFIAIEDIIFQDLPNHLHNVILKKITHSEKNQVTFKISTDLEYRRDFLIIGFEKNGTIYGNSYTGKISAREITLSLPVYIIARTDYSINSDLIKISEIKLH